MKSLPWVLLVSLTVSCIVPAASPLEAPPDSGADPGLSQPAVGRESPNAQPMLQDRPAADSPWFESPDIATDALVLAAARLVVGADLPLDRVEVPAEDPLLRRYFFEGADPVTFSKRLSELPQVGGADPSLDWRVVLDAVAEVEQEAARLGIEDSLSEQAPPVACSAACGRDDRTTYAGIEAMSNGSYTGTGSSCAGGDSYQ
jgi:hypothetical protein